MSEFDEKYQQQILFSEDNLTKVKPDESTQTKQVVVSNLDWQPEDEIAVSLDDEPAISTKPKWLWRTIFALLSTVVVIEGYSFFTAGFIESPITTSIYAALVASIGILAGASLFREFVGLRQFKKQQKFQDEITEILAGSTTLKAKTLCNQISDKLPSDIGDDALQQWQDTNIDEYSDAEVVELYSRIVLAKIDQKAIAEIAKFSSESVVLIALSPVAILDMFIMLWRNLKMLDKIAGLYGLKLGYWSRIKLIRQVFINMVYAGASELVTDFGADMLGADILGKLSGRLAQGLGAGLLTARLGLKALKLCRPIPFDKNGPKLGHIRGKMLEQIKTLTLKGK